MNVVKKIAGIAVNVLLWIIIIIVAFFAIVTFSRKGGGDVASIFGFTPMTVLTESMAPTFNADDLIVVKSDDKNAYEVGDIISFWTSIENQRVINTHRIVEVVGDSTLSQYITRGDANAKNDTFLVAPDDIIGKYAFSVPFLGKVLAVISSSTGFLIIIVLPLLALFIYQLYRLIMITVELKKQTVIDATKQAMAQIEKEKADDVGSSDTDDMSDTK